MVQLELLSLLSFGLSIAKATSIPKACNPLKATGCSADAALATSFAEDFSKNSSWFPYFSGGGLVNYTSGGLSMTLDKRYDNPTLMSDFYIMYGKVEVELKAGAGRGVVSSFFLQSDDLDELDIEWVGSDNTQFQSNYFSKGNTTTYDRGKFHGVDSPVDKFHNYTLDWNVDKATWGLDGQVVRTLSNDSSEGYPQTPMFIKMGIWAGGDPSNAKGTIEWAGGEVDYSQAPFTMYIKRVVVTDYSSGKTYSYKGKTGSWESIEADDGEILGRVSKANEEYGILNQGGHISSSPSHNVRARTHTGESTQSTITHHKKSNSSVTSAFGTNSTLTPHMNSTIIHHKNGSTGAISTHKLASKTSSEKASRSTLKPTSSDVSKEKDNTSSASGSTQSSSASSLSSASSVSGSTQSSSSSSSSASSVSGSTQSSSSSSSSSASSVADVKKVSNVAAALGFSRNSLPFLAAVMALVL